MMSVVKKALLIVLVLLSCVGCDQATKAIARERLQSAPPVYVLGDVFVLEYAENTGAFLGLGSRLPETVRFWSFVVLVGIILAGMVGFIWTSQDIDLLGILGGSLIVGGGLGNLIDRLANAGVVVDFMNLGLGNLRTGVFNVADLAVVVGAGIMFLSVGRKRSDRAAEDSETTP